MVVWQRAAGGHTCLDMWFWGAHPAPSACVFPPQYVTRYGEKYGTAEVPHFGVDA